MPSPEEIRGVVRRYAKLMCDSDASAIADLYADDCRVEDPVGGARVQGKEAIRGFYAATAPHLQVEISGPICVAGSLCSRTVCTLPRTRSIVSHLAPSKYSRS